MGRVRFVVVQSMETHLAKVDRAQLECLLVLLEDILATRERLVVAARGGGNLPGKQTRRNAARKNGIGRGESWSHGASVPNPNAHLMTVSRWPDVNCCAVDGNASIDAYLAPTSLEKERRSIMFLAASLIENVFWFDESCAKKMVLHPAM